MSSTPNRAIATLVRWREFQEARASDEFRQRTAHTRHAKAGVDTARTAVEQAQQHRMELLASPNLDVARLLMTAQIEDGHWSLLQEREAAHAAAQVQQGESRARHVAARAQTRVAEARKKQQDAELRDRAEKVSFDWTADLHNQHRGNRDD